MVSQDDGSSLSAPTIRRAGGTGWGLGTALAATGRAGEREGGEAEWVIRRRRGARSAGWPAKEVSRLYALIPLFVEHRFSVLSQGAPVLDLAESVSKLEA